MTRLREQHAAAHELWQQGMSKAAIGRKLGLHQATVRKLVNAPSADDVVAKSLQRAHVVDPYVGYLHRRWNEGVRNAVSPGNQLGDQPVIHGARPTHSGLPGLGVTRHVNGDRMPDGGPETGTTMRPPAWRAGRKRRLS